MKRIMFVCHGNICRSPMAEFIFKKMIAERGRADEFTVRSSATSTEEIPFGRGNPIYPPAKAMLRERGVSFDEDKRACLLLKSDYEKYDAFICMDSKNMRNMLRIFGSDPCGKIHRLLDFTSDGGDVADPWYTSDFEKTYADLSVSCEKLLSMLLKNK